MNAMQALVCDEGAAVWYDLLEFDLDHSFS
jgi:hypothetical protein